MLKCLSLRRQNFIELRLLETALTLLTSKAITAQNNLMILGQPLEEIKLREGLEKVLRSLAHLSSGDEKIGLVDEANRVRPQTLF
ncbi:tetratricopeptide repeat protein [Chamaesiphon sp.]|uniref:tetratricopeptide repeat protein n=1 Tax=Chamaesiphon sp. TaxID=2814140 RepID=UPI003593E876